MSTTNSKIVVILQKLQDRLTRTARETHVNTDEVAALRDEIRLKTDDLFVKAVDLKDKSDDSATKIIGLVSRTQTLADRIRENQTLEDTRETQQTIRDQNNVQALHSLRDSTKKSFDKFAQDVETILKTLQRFNERISQVENVNPFLMERVRDLEKLTRANGLNVDELLKFMARIETTPVPASLPSDHIWVNKKLTGVYDSVEDLQDQIDRLEAAATASQSASLKKSLSRVIDQDGYCTDAACKQQQDVRHYFGPGCRFYEPSY